MKIRKAKESDILRVSEIYDEIHRQEDAGKLTIGWKTDVYPIKEDAEGAYRKGELFVLEDGDKIFGSAIINEEQLDCYKIGKWQGKEPSLVMHTLTIDPNASRQGYGQGFVNFYEDFARKNGFLSLRIDTQEKNLTARAMYKKLGFSEVCTTSCKFNGIDAVKIILLEKIL